MRVRLTVTLCAVPPWTSGTELGFTLLRLMLEAGLIVNVRAFDMPPPGEAFTTVTETVPEVARSLAEIAAANCLLLTKVAVRARPFHCTVEPETKFVPVTVRVKAAPPAVALEGESKLAVGIGLLMVKVRAFDVPPPGEGFTAVTEAVPAVAMSLAKIAAVNCVPVTKVVTLGLAFHCTVEPEAKFVPVTVSVNAAPPAVAELGERLVMVGRGLFTVKVTEFDAPPPGAGLVTTTA